MGFFDFLTPALDSVFRPVLHALGPTWFVVVVSACLSFLIVIVYRFATDQNLMKRLKTEIKELQAELKTLKNDKDKMMEVNKRMAETNMKYFMQSMKSSIYTLLPIILIYAYLNSVIAFEPIMPGEDFSVTLSFDEVLAGNVSVSAPQGLEVTGHTSKRIAEETIFTFAGNPGEYLIVFDTDSGSFDHTVKIQDDYGYAPQTTSVKDSHLQTITTQLNKLIVFNLFGWKLGWFGMYIIISILGSMLFRKLLKVY